MYTCFKKNYFRGLRNISGSSCFHLLMVHDMYSKCFMGFWKTQKTGIDLFLVSKDRFFFAIYLFFDPIKLALCVCSPCVCLSMTCFFIKNYGGGWELCVCVWRWGKRGVLGQNWTKIWLHNMWICFLIKNRPKICANEASSGQNWQFLIVQNLLNILD